uniref:Uncharacterized protein n=1 Tax=Streptomyces sp. NBC_00049 TaxID=2903617 RepID=A0AAU2JXF7_9ACTN
MSDQEESKGFVEDSHLNIAARSADVSAPTSDEQGGIQRNESAVIPAQSTEAESPTVAIARERLVEAIGREAVFLADQRAGQASEGLEALARAFALVASPVAALTASPAAAQPQVRIAGNLTQSMGAAFSGSEQSAGVGVGAGW